MYNRNCEIKPGVEFPDGMHRIALGVEYNGGEFRGFQMQQQALATVQGELQAALSSIADEPITLVAAGRTDAGVHACGQTIHFDTLAVRPMKAWSLGANGRLPAGINIRWAMQVPAEFHARFSALSRTYRYVIYNHPIRSSLANSLVSWQKRPMDYALLPEAASALVGEHDFSAFRAAQCQAKHAVRSIEHIRFARYRQLIVMEVKANAFLHHMVRNIVGALFAVSCGDKPASWMQAVLHSKDRRLNAATATASGLYLVDVDYPAWFGLPKQLTGPWFLPESLDWDQV